MRAMTDAMRDDEWLETDGLGGYAMGSASGIRHRRYHGLLMTASRPPAGRIALVKAVEAWVEGPRGRAFLSSHRYASGVLHPDGARRIETFSTLPWPRWTYRFEDGTLVAHELVMSRGLPRIALAWRVIGELRPLTLFVRPLLSFADHHALERERPWPLATEIEEGRVRFRLAAPVPELVVLANNAYTQAPDWYRGFLYEEEANRGFDAIEDLASPGFFRFDLLGREAALVLAADGAGIDAADNAAGLVSRIKHEEATRRARFASPLQRAADAYLVRRGEGLSIIAGYPWFTDWGRDTFIAVRGLCLATGRYDEAESILAAWVRALDGGMLPNRFPEDGAPEFNAVDASLWFVVAVGALLERRRLRERRRFLEAIGTIVDAYRRGARYGIRAERDGLLACGVPGTQLTWMDAKIGDQVVTPRIGKPVEVQALWINALAVAARIAARFDEPLARARAAFEQRFWNDAGGYLYDVVDCDHVPGAVDASFRANQVFAVGGLPLAVMSGPRARRLVDAVEERLWTPAGPRTLAPGEPGYVGRYRGAAAERDAAYHQGTVWPYLTGAFVEAWLRVRGDTAAARREARTRFFTPLLTRLDPTQSGHLPELADAESPHRPGGCPFQAWSVGEALRLDLEVLALPH